MLLVWSKEEWRFHIHSNLYLHLTRLHLMRRQRSEYNIPSNQSAACVIGQNVEVDGSILDEETHEDIKV